VQELGIRLPTWLMSSEWTLTTMVVRPFVQEALRGPVASKTSSESKTSQVASPLESV